MYSEDGLVYPAVVLWVKGQRCRIRFDNYNNEEEQDVGRLLNPDELHGPSRAAAAKVETWTWTGDQTSVVLENRGSASQNHMYYITQCYCDIMSGPQRRSSS